MLNNDELRLISDVIEYLSMLRGSKAIYFSQELDKMYYKYTEKKKELSKRSNEYNYKHMEKHLLSKKIRYHKKRNNQERVKELTKKLEELQNDQNK